MITKIIHSKHYLSISSQEQRTKKMMMKKIQSFTLVEQNEVHLFLTLLSMR